MLRAYLYRLGGKMMANLYSISEVARLLDVQPYQITYAHCTNKVPEPRRVCGRRAYLRADLIALARHFNVEFTVPAFGPGKEEGV